VCDANPTLGCGEGTTQIGFECVPDSTTTCGFGTVPEEDECVVDPALTQELADLEADLGQAEAERDQALADLDNLYTNNTCVPLAGTIQHVLDCINNLNTDLAAAEASIADFEAILQSGKITICHNGDKTKTINVGSYANHFEHGDPIGPCP